MQKKILFSFSLVLLTLALFCNVALANLNKDWRDDVIYSIMVDRFNDGDPKNNFQVDKNNLKAFHGGDIQGIIDKLDYIKDLGATVIWLTPVVQNQEEIGREGAYAYHGYWPTDFYKVDKRFGDLPKFKELVEKAHQRGLKVMLDFVVNHTGYKHPWRSDPKYKSWFNNRGEVTDWTDPDQVLYGDLYELPDLNQNNPEVEKYLIDMAKWWLKETKVDALRLDAVKHVPMTFWEKFCTEINKENPGIYMMGENFSGNVREITPYQEAGFQGMIDFPMYSAIRSVFLNEESMEAISNILKDDTLYRNPSLLSTFIENHDVQRFMTAGRDGVSIAAADDLADVTDEELEAYLDKFVPLDMKLSIAFQMMIRGIPIIYYGEEVAMEGGADPDNRRDMQWDKDPAMKEYVKKLIRIRKYNPALRKGTMRELFVDEKHYAFVRSYEGNNVIVVINNSRQEDQMEVTLNDIARIKNGLVLKNVLAPDTVTVEDGNKIKLKMQPKEIKIYIVNETAKKK